MRAGGHALGGEQSGHTVLLDHATTGDGLLSGLSVLGRMAETGRSLTDLASVMTRLPQVLVNVRAERSRAQADDVLAAVEVEERLLGEAGRVLLRPSGNRAAGAGDGRGRERRAGRAGGGQAGGRRRALERWASGDALLPHRPAADRPVGAVQDGALVGEVAVGRSGRGGIAHNFDRAGGRAGWRAGALPTAHGSPTR